MAQELIEEGAIVLPERQREQIAYGSAFNGGKDGVCVPERRDQASQKPNNRCRPGPQQPGCQNQRQGRKGNHQRGSVIAGNIGQRQGFIPGEMNPNHQTGKNRAQYQQGQDQPKTRCFGVKAVLLQEPQKHCSHDEPAQPTKQVVGTVNKGGQREQRQIDHRLKVLFGHSYSLVVLFPGVVVIKRVA
ncbi:hypothetical protein SDC9_130018 [bioreactor metagenome]|uniref:Uncharacterized protein n=1 Tax=bioreactor metagenome TaxID=1076179 RepID=A0A645D0K6_9ZZZZ